MSRLRLVSKAPPAQSSTIAEHPSIPWIWAYIEGSGHTARNFVLGIWYQPSVLGRFCAFARVDIKDSRKAATTPCLGCHEKYKVCHISNYLLKLTRGFDTRINVNLREDNTELSLFTIPNDSKDRLGRKDLMQPSMYHPSEFPLPFISSNHSPLNVAKYRCWVSGAIPIADHRMITVTAEM